MTGLGALVFARAPGAFPMRVGSGLGGQALGLRLLAAACVGVCGVTGMEAGALFGMGAGVVAAIMLAAAKPPGALPAFVSVLVGDRYF